MSNLATDFQAHAERERVGVREGAGGSEREREREGEREKTGRAACGDSIVPAFHDTACIDHHGRKNMAAMLIFDPTYIFYSQRTAMTTLANSIDHVLANMIDHVSALDSQR